MIITFPDITVEITNSVMRALSKFEQNSGCHEAGGILLGKYIPEEEYYLISEITEPNSYDQFGPLYFIRSCQSAQNTIEKRWEESRGIVNYLGEWHTHPVKNPIPSTTDRKLLVQIVEERSNVWRHIFMIILGTNKTFYLGVADCKHRGKIIRETVRRY